MSTQEENLCMQQKVWTLVADFIVSVYPYTIHICDYKRQCKYSGVNHALKDSLLSPVTLHANATWEHCCLNPHVVISCQYTVM